MPRFSALLLAAACTAAHAQDTPAKAPATPPQTLADRTAKMQHMPGLLALDYDAKAGKVFLEVPLDSKGRSSDLLYSLSLPHGAGSNDLGLDRGQIGGVGEGGAGVLVYFQRSGPKVLLMQPNLKFRSTAADPAEQQSVHESFAESVMFGFKVESESPDGTVLLDATDFFVRDARGVAEALAAARQGTYKFDVARSALVPEVIRAFPKNIVVESVVTVSTDVASRSARYVRDVTPDPRAVTVHERQMFIALPGPGFTPRRFSPRAGYFDASYRDYNAPLGDPLDQPFITRHRLLKADPRCTKACIAVAPIQYYVDRGAPEPIRSALVEGARWWDDAFQAAGWAPGTFRVDVLPADADPMDVRYNIIQWVHRYTRGWSYGASIADPRTGEIIKGQVTLGSLRGRQDYLIAVALLAPYANGKTTGAPANDPMLAMVLQRIRQLAAHETGHTLGLAHNFAASSVPHPVDQTVSVMDYPHPYVTLDRNGVPDLTHAYPVGIGTWDKAAIDYGYREFDAAGTPTENPVALDAILSRAEHSGLVYLTDADARPLGSASPRAHLWDNGTDPADELNRVLTLRAAALTRFGQNNIQPGADLAQLEDTLVPLYLFHRYQTEAAAKEIGGLDYRYNVRLASGQMDGQPLPEIVAPDAQRKALAAVLRTLSPEVLTLPEPLLRQLPPRPQGLARNVESFPAHTGLTFDPVAAAESAADLTLALLTEPARASRLVEYHDRNPAAPSLDDVLEAVLPLSVATSAAQPETLNAEVARAVEMRAVEAVLTLAVNAEASSQARAVAREHAAALLQSLTASSTAPGPDHAHRAAMADRIREFQHDPEKFTPAKGIEAPPGMPIGDDEE